MNYDAVNRLEIIDADGRSYQRLGVVGMTFDLQDQGRTLKIFVTSDPKTAKQTREQILDELVKFSQELGMYDDIIPQEPK
jgi:hypothetical protein